MTLDELWTIHGLLKAGGEGSDAVRLRYPIVVQPLGHPDNAPEQPAGTINTHDTYGAYALRVQAGLMEVVARIGLESLVVPTPIFGEVFIERELHPSHMDTKVGPQQGVHQGVQAVVGWSWDWLKGMLAEAGISSNQLDELQSLYDTLPADHGLLWISDTNVLVVSGKSSLGMQSAMRALASDNFGHGFPNNGSTLTVAPVSSTSQPVTDRANGNVTDTVNATDNGYATAGAGHGVPLHEILSNIGASATGSPDAGSSDGGSSDGGSSANGVFEGSGSVSGSGGDNRPVLPEADVQLRLLQPMDDMEALLGLTARIGLECGSLRFPVTCVDTETPRWTALQLHFAVDPATAANSAGTAGGSEAIGSQADASKATVSLDGNKVTFVSPCSSVLSDMLRDVTNHWFEPPSDVDLADWRGKLAALTNPAPDIRLRAQTEALLTRLQQNNDGINGISVPSHLRKTVSAWCHHHNVHLEVDEDPELFSLDWSGQSEWATMQSALQQDLEQVQGLQQVQQGQQGQEIQQIQQQIQASLASTDKVRVEVFTTVPQHVFEQDINASGLMTSGLATPGLATSWPTGNHLPIEFVYRNVTKAGLDWFLTDVLPVVKTNDQISAIEISAQRLPDNPHLLDLPQRFLQEFFPVDVMVEQETHLSRNDVTLALYDVTPSSHEVPSSLHGEFTPMYIVTARNQRGEVVRRWEWESPVETRLYMPGDLTREVVVPAVGYHISLVDETGSQIQTLAKRSISSVYTRFWDWYQTEVIEKIVSAKRATVGPTAFARLEIEVWVNGTEERLGVYEEVVSWPEALHEDLYFYTLQALREHGETVHDPIWKTPGLIVPLIHITEGETRAQVRAYTYARDEMYVNYESGEKDQINLPNQVTNLDANSAHALTYQGGVWNVVIDNTLSTVQQSQAQQSDVQHPQVQQLVDWLNEESRSQHNLITAVIPESELDPPSASFEDDNTRMRNLQNNDVIGWLNHHANELPGRSWVIDHSFEGRPIIAVELYHPTQSGLTSRHKHALYKPTWVVLARHHANEISSTNSAIHLMETVIHQPNLLQKFNLVIVPVHNTDGAALHRKLVEEHRYWKHHAARFNACGYEFSGDYFKPDTRFGESRVAARIWDLWKPDIVLDDHGIPSHEWLQPFSGYSSPPSFPVSYWIPHAQMYTIWREFDPTAPPAPDGLLQTVSRALHEDTVVRARNAEFLDRYLKWGHAFSPEKFPVTTVDGVITYRWPVNPSPSSVGFMGRYPDLVTADIVTEVNDETVHEEALFEVVHAHDKAHDGILAWLNRLNPKVNHIRHLEPEHGFVRIGLKRDRPLE